MTEKTTEKAKARPCASCPWMRASQTPEAIAASPVDGRGVHWFDPDNLRNRWTFCAHEGGMMPCHATDNKAHWYGGVRAQCETGGICVGLTILAKREVHHFMECGGDFRRYKRTPGLRMTLEGLAMWAARLLYPGATFNIDGRILTMPDVADLPIADVTVPWSDEVHTKARKRRKADR